MNFTHIFFDLDHTLWDYDTNAREVLRDIYEKFDMKEQTFHGPDRFIEVFFKVNNSLWQQYNQGNINKDQIRQRRFENVFSKLNISGFDRGEEMSEYFLFNCPRQPRVMEGAISVVNYLQSKYHMSIVTNGFDDVQSIKLAASGLNKYFSHVFTSENTGYKKPNRGIFDHAMKELVIEPETILMIGDNHSTDIMGARNAGIKPLLFNPSGKVKSDCELQINHLSELIELL
ncbi:MAG: YjjG family noncanonical pyrimidine nucleotidase [Cyclobacteriaceae bacterium]